MAGSRVERASCRLDGPRLSATRTGAPMHIPTIAASSRRMIPGALLFLAVTAPHPVSAQGSSSTDTTGAATAVARQPNRDSVPAVPPPALSPSGLRVTALSAAGSTTFALSGAAMGNTLDYARCRRARRGETGGFFSDPCAFYYADGTVAGWYGGAFLGATVGAAIGAMRRGCPVAPSWWRAAGGAALGLLPGALSGAAGGEKFPPSRSWLIMTTPIVSGAGAALAVRGCHR